MAKMRDFLSSGTGIVALVLTMLGAVFTLTGAALTILITQWQIGGSFLGLGGGVLTVGLILGLSRLMAIRRQAHLKQTGIVTSGIIVEVAQNFRVRINGRNPWVIRYRYEVQGRTYEGRERMMDLPTAYTLGTSVAVVYDARNAGQSAIKQG